MNKISKLQRNLGWITKLQENLTYINISFWLKFLILVYQHCVEYIIPDILKLPILLKEVFSIVYFAYRSGIERRQNCRTWLWNYDSFSSKNLVITNQISLAIETKGFQMIQPIIVFLYEKYLRCFINCVLQSFFHAIDYLFYLIIQLQNVFIHTLNIPAEKIFILLLLVKIHMLGLLVIASSKISLTEETELI